MQCPFCESNKTRKSYRRGLIETLLSPLPTPHRCAARERRFYRIGFWRLGVAESAYRDLRLKRADLRRQNQRISGTVLAETLFHYSERGQAYVDNLKALIRQNR